MHHIWWGVFEDHKPLWRTKTSIQSLQFLSIFASCFFLRQNVWCAICHWHVSSFWFQIYLHVLYIPAQEENVNFFWNDKYVVCFLTLSVVSLEFAVPEWNKLLCVHSHICALPALKDEEVIKWLLSVSNPPPHSHLWLLQREGLRVFFQKENISSLANPFYPIEQHVYVNEKKKTHITRLSNYCLMKTMFPLSCNEEWAGIIGLFVSN